MIIDIPAEELDDIIHSLTRVVTHLKQIKQHSEHAEKLNTIRQKLIKHTKDD